MSKFSVGQTDRRNNRTKTKMITDPKELCRFLVTPGIEVCTSLYASDDVLWLIGPFIEEKIPSLHHTNEVIGAYVTTGTRLKLYSYLGRLQQKVLYCDTDSVF
jgi:hypothetical protein